MGRLRYSGILAAGLAGGLALNGSNCNCPESTNPRAPYSLEETCKTDETMRRDISGFGKVEKMSRDYFPVKMHAVYKTESGYYLGKLGAKLYVIDGKSGKLLSRGGFSVTRLTDGFESNVGSDRYHDKLDKKPTSHKEFKDEGLEEKFEEKNGGVYVRNLKI